MFVFISLNPSWEFQLLHLKPTVWTNLFNHKLSQESPPTTRLAHQSERVLVGDHGPDDRVQAQPEHAVDRGWVERGEGKEEGAGAEDKRYKEGEGRTAAPVAGLCSLSVCFVFKVFFFCDLCFIVFKKVYLFFFCLFDVFIF